MQNDRSESSLRNEIDSNEPQGRHSSREATQCHATLHAPLISFFPSLLLRLGALSRGGALPKKRSRSDGWKPNDTNQRGRGQAQAQERSQDHLRLLFESRSAPRTLFRRRSVAIALSSDRRSYEAAWLLERLCAERDPEGGVIPVATSSSTHKCACLWLSAQTAYMIHDTSRPRSPCLAHDGDAVLRHSAHTMIHSST